MSAVWFQPRAPAAPPVDFLIAGVQKGGTTALDAYLRAHPALCFPARKELHFFDDEERFAARRVDYADYHANFARARAHRLAGESTPIYLYWDAAPRRIWTYNPRMKLIAVLRNPIARAYSHWNMERERGADPLPFGEALRAEAGRALAARPHQDKVFSYMDRGFYSHQLRRLWRFFPREQTLVLRHEELRDRPAEIVRRVTDFLGVDPLPGVAFRDIHSRPYVAPMARADWDCLRGVFEGEIIGLQQLLGWDLSRWLDPPRDAN